MRFNKNTVFTLREAVTEMTEILTIDHYIQELNRIQDYLLSMPEEKVMEESFAQEQEKLERLIELLPRFAPEEQKRAHECIRRFSEKLTQKLEQLKVRLKAISHDMEGQEMRMKGIKAYGGKQKLL